MFGFGNKKKQMTAQQPLKAKGTAPVLRSEQEQTMTLEEQLKALFAKDDQVKFHTVVNTADPSIALRLMYFDGMIDSTVVEEHVIKPLSLRHIPFTEGNLLQTLQEQIVSICQIEKSSDLDKLITSITYGDTLLFEPDGKEALILNTRSLKTRANTEPEAEKVLTGPHEGFSESILENMALIRRKVRSHELKMQKMELGDYTKTSVIVCYLNNIVNPELLDMLKKRLQSIQIDSVLDVNYISELIRDNPTTPFRTTGLTERPDVVVGKILEGRIAVLVDGSPVVMTVPYLFIENFQNSEDYYLNYYYGTISRILRIVGFIIAISLPGFYIAIVAYHREMLPTALFINLAAGRRNVPFPSALEAFVLLFIFDLIRETGMRVPINVGQALSIVGALVIGQASVQAKLVTAPMIIMVALTAISSLLIPKLDGVIVLFRFFLLTMASTFGLYGLTLGLSAVIIHIANLKSLGAPQLTPVDKLQYAQAEDLIVRKPWPRMIRHVTGLAQKSQNKVRD